MALWPDHFNLTEHLGHSGESQMKHIGKLGIKVPL
jgi:hypothetical protein